MTHTKRSEHENKLCLTKNAQNKNLIIMLVGTFRLFNELFIKINN